MKKLWWILAGLGAAFVALFGLRRSTSSKRQKQAKAHRAKANKFMQKAVDHERAAAKAELELAEQQQKNEEDSSRAEKRVDDACSSDDPVDDWDGFSGR